MRRSAEIRIEADELATLALDLAGAPLRIQFGARKVINHGRKMVEIAMRDDARDARRSRPSSIKHLPRAVTSDMTGPLSAVMGLGPGRPGGQGSLAHILAYGSVNNAPIYDHTAAIRRATPEILDMLGREGEDAVLGRARRR